jgi:flagellar basal-body rod modification protein FlgD
MSPITPTGPQQDALPAAGQANTRKDLVSQDAFLQLLVAQIKNQDPLNPADGTQFLSQLAQFSELEQLIGIRNELRGKAIVSPTGTTNNNS